MSNPLSSVLDSERIWTLDDWGGAWSELVPHVDVAESALTAAPSNDAEATADLDPMRFPLVDLEPLIGELWKRAMDPDFESPQMASTLHFTLISVSDAMRQSDRTMLRSALAMLLTAVLGLATSVAGAAIYEAHADRLRAIIERAW